MCRQAGDGRDHLGGPNRLGPMPLEAGCGRTESIFGSGMRRRRDLHGQKKECRTCKSTARGQAGHSVLYSLNRL